jgi:hypothetical protein
MFVYLQEEDAMDAEKYGGGSTSWIGGRNEHKVQT